MEGDRPGSGPVLAVQQQALCQRSGPTASLLLHCVLSWPGWCCSPHLTGLDRVGPELLLLDQNCFKTDSREIRTRGLNLLVLIRSRFWWTDPECVHRRLCWSCPSPGLRPAEGSFGPGAVPAGRQARCRVGGGSVGPGRVHGGRVPLPVRSQPERGVGGAVRLGSVEAGPGEEGHAGEAAGESGGGRGPSVRPGGRRPVSKPGPNQNQRSVP